MTTHRARAFEVTVRPYREGHGMEQGWVAVPLNAYTLGEPTVTVDPDGWELSTENFPLAALKEKAAWTPGTNLVPVVYARGARHLIWPGWFLVRFPGGLELPMGPNEVAALFEPVKREEELERS